MTYVPRLEAPGIMPDYGMKLQGGGPDGPPRDFDSGPAFHTANFGLVIDRSDSPEPRIY